MLTLVSQFELYDFKAAEGSVSQHCLLQCLSRDNRVPVINLFLCSTQQSMKFFLLINLKCQQWLSGKTNISCLSDPEKKLNFLIFFYNYEHLKSHIQMS